MRIPAVLLAAAFVCSAGSQGSYTPGAAVLKSMAGTYEGEVFNGDNRDPVRTMLKIDESGALVGEYMMGEETKLEFGTLADARFVDQYTVQFDWKDVYGAGSVRILFAADYRAFSGYWGKSPDSTTLPWTGVRE